MANFLGYSPRFLFWIILWLYYRGEEIMVFTNETLNEERLLATQSYRDLVARISRLERAGARVEAPTENIQQTSVALSSNQSHDATQFHLDTELSQFIELGYFPFIIDKDLDNPPGGETRGDSYIVATGGGVWAGLDNYIVKYEPNQATWDSIAPLEGMVVYVKDENLLYVYTGAAWVALGTIINNLPFDQIANPNNDVDINFANKHLHLIFTSPSTESGVILEGIGNFAGKDILHIHQHTGVLNAEARLIHLEWVDAGDIIPMRWSQDGGTFFMRFDMAAISADRLVTYPDKDLVFAIDTAAEAIAAIEAEGTLHQSGTIQVDDNNPVIFGTNSDADILHDDSNFFVDNNKGSFFIRSLAAGGNHMYFDSHGAFIWRDLDDASVILAKLDTTARTMEFGLAADPISVALTGNIGFYGTAAQAQSAAYTPANVNADRAFDADATTLDEIADVLGTLINDLQTYGLIG